MSQNVKKVDPFSLPFSSKLVNPDCEEWEEVETICKTLSRSDPHSSFSCSSSKYQSKLQNAVQILDPVFGSGGLIRTTISSLGKACEKLDEIESDLDDVIVSLEENISSLYESGSQLTAIRRKHEKLSIIDEQIAGFSKTIQVPPSLLDTIRDANPHSIEFKEALSVLSEKLSATNNTEVVQSKAIQAFHEEIASIKDVAMNRLSARLETSMKLLQEPSSTFEILRDTLLYKQRHLISFASKHWEGFSDRFVQEYVSTTKGALNSRFESYCESLASWAHLNISPRSSFDLSSIRKGTSGIFSAIFTETLSGSSHIQDVLAHSGGGKILSSLHSYLEEGKMDVHRKRILELMNRWTSAVNALNSPYLAQADIMLKQRETTPFMEDLCLNSTKFFIDMVEKETKFLEQTFGIAYSRICDNIFETSELQFLSLIEAQMESFPKNHSDIEGMLICLLLNRVHRSHISPWEARDVRIDFMIKVEAALQVRLLDEMDKQIEKVAELQDDLGQSGFRELHNANLLASSASLAMDIFAILLKSSTEIQDCTSDIDNILHRRLLSLMKYFVKAMNFTNIESPDRMDTQKTKLRRTAVMLTMLQLPQTLSEKSAVLTHLLEPMDSHFNSLCIIYAENVIPRLTLPNVNEALKSDNCDKLKYELVAFKEALEGHLRKIRDEFTFLRNENISTELQNRAIRISFNVFVEKYEEIGQRVEKYFSALKHLIMQRTSIEEICENVL